MTASFRLLILEGVEGMENRQGHGRSAAKPIHARTLLRRQADDRQAKTPRSLLSGASWSRWPVG